MSRKNNAAVAVSAQSPVNHIRQSARFLESEGRRLFLLESKVDDPVGSMVLVSPFGRTVHDLFLLNHFLNCNGFDCFRFDPRDHDGLSGGEMEDFTLPGLARDTAAACQAFAREPGLPTLMLGMSLSFPVALRHAARARDIDGLLGVVGVVDVEDTLDKAVGVHPREYRKPVITAPTIVEPFGCRIRAKHFVEALDAGEYATRADFERELRRLDKPLYMLAADDDEYVAIADVIEVFHGRRGPGRLNRMSGVAHEIGRSVGAAKLVAEQVVRDALHCVGAEERGIPNLVDVIAASQQETEYLGSFTKAPGPRALP